MSRKLLLRDCVRPITTDLAPEHVRQDSVDTDPLVSRCMSRTLEALKTPRTQFTDMEREHLSLILRSMLHTHRAIQRLLRTEHIDPISVNAMPLVRTQIETLFALCLIVEKPSEIASYEKDWWKKHYIRDLLLREECRSLPRIMSFLDAQAAALESARKVAGVTEQEKATVDHEEMGVPLPPGFKAAKIEAFPMPRTIIDRVREQDRKAMLMRLYPEYQLFCSFVHVSPGPRLMTGLLEPNLPIGRESGLTPQQIEDKLRHDIVVPATWMDLLSIVQSCSELCCIYPGDVELHVVLTETWNVLTERTLIGKSVWESRSRTLLGAI
jgi:hypothetical protein